MNPPADTAQGDNQPKALEHSSLFNLENERATAGFTLAFEELKLKVEALLFAADRPLEVTEIRDFIENVSLTDVRLAIKDLGHDFEGRSVEILEIGRKYQLRTRPTFIDTVSKLFSGKPRTLSKSALETLAIVAYRQPVTRAEVNALRQVDSSQVMISLREKELIYPSGTRKEAGHPVEYKTSAKFLDVFGLSDLSELPKLRSLQLGADDTDQVKAALSQLEESPENIEKPEQESEILNFIDEPRQGASSHFFALPDAEADFEADANAEDDTETRAGAGGTTHISQKNPEPAPKKRAAASRLGSVEGLLRPIKTVSISETQPETLADSDSENSPDA